MKSITRVRTRTGPSSKQAKSRPYLACLFRYHPSQKTCQRRKPSRPPFYMSPPPSPGSRHWVMSSGHVLRFVGPLGKGKTSLGQFIARALGRPFQRIAVECAMKPGYEVTVGLTLPSDLAYLHRRYARLVVWSRFYYCKHFT